MLINTNDVDLWCRTYLHIPECDINKYKINYCYDTEHKLIHLDNDCIINEKRCVNDGMLPFSFGNTKKFEIRYVDYTSTHGFPLLCESFISSYNNIIQVLDLSKIKIINEVSIGIMRNLKTIILPRLQRTLQTNGINYIECKGLPGLELLDFSNICSIIDCCIMYCGTIDFNTFKNAPRFRNLKMNNQNIKSFDGIENITINNRLTLNCTELKTFCGIEKLKCYNLQLHNIKHVEGLLNILNSKINILDKSSMLYDFDIVVCEILCKYFNYKNKSERIMDCCLEFLENDFVDISL